MSTITLNKPNILTLDIATLTGWSCIKDGVPKCGTFKTVKKKNDHPYTEFLQFARWINTVMPQFKPELIVLESPGFFRSPLAGMKPYGFRSLVFVQAALHDIAVESYSPSTIKKFATGYGKAPKGAKTPDEKKAPMIAYARRRFPSLTVANGDEADALCLLSYALSTVYGIEELT